MKSGLEIKSLNGEKMRGNLNMLGEKTYFKKIIISPKSIIFGGIFHHEQQILLFFSLMFSLIENIKYCRLYVAYNQTTIQDKDVYDSEKNQRQADTARNRIQPGLRKKGPQMQRQSRQDYITG